MTCRTRIIEFFFLFPTSSGGVTSDRAVRCDVVLFHLFCAQGISHFERLLRRTAI